MLNQEALQNKKVRMAALLFKWEMHQLHEMKTGSHRALGADR